MSGRSVASMKKWGIPASNGKHGKGRGGPSAPEIALLERLVWVRYQNHWWPALLYHSYTELQQHLYDRLDMVLKAQFAMAIMRHMQEKKEIKVARLLGRPILEVIEVEEDCYCEFYWQLPNVLPKACNKSRYAGNMELYYDFHRALDQVEDIIRDVSQENFALMPKQDHQTWSERAQHYASEDLSAVRSPTPLPYKGKPPKSSKGGSKSGGSSKRSERSKKESHKGESGKEVGAIDVPPLTDVIPKSPTADLPPQKDPEAAEHIGMWGLLKSYSQSVEDFVKGGSVADGGGNGMAVNSLETGTTKVETVTSMENKESPEDQEDLPQASECITRDHRLRRPNVTGDEAQGYEMEMMIGRSHKNRTRSRRSMQKGNKETESNEARLPPSRDPNARASHLTEPAGGSVTQYDKYALGPPPPAADESRDPPSESSTSAAKLRAAKKKEEASLPTPAELPDYARNSPVHILPGLEGDDILPGLSNKVVNARDIWSTVWGQMMVSKGDEDNARPLSNVSERESETVSDIRKAMQQKSLLDSTESVATGKTGVTNKVANTTSASAEGPGQTSTDSTTDPTQSTEQAKANNLAVPDQGQQSSFWHSMLGCAPATY